MMSSERPSVFAGCLDCFPGIYLTAALSALLIGFYYAMAGADAMMPAGIILWICFFFMAVSHAGICFSAAAFAARSDSRKDYRSVLYVRMLSGMVSIGAGALVTLLMLLLAPLISRLILSGSAPESDIVLLSGCLRLISPAAVLNGALMWMRGFYQGLDEFRIDRRSQIIQIVSFYFFAAAISLILIYGFHLNRITTVYALCGACALSLLTAFGYWFLFDRMRLKKLKKMAKAQMIPPMKKKKIFSDMFSFCTPGAVTLTAGALIPLAGAVSGMRVLLAAKVSWLQAQRIIGVYTLMCPMIAYLPVTAAFRIREKSLDGLCEAQGKAQRSKKAEQMIISLIYAVLPFSFSLMCLAPQVFHVIFGSELASAGNLAMTLCAAQGFLYAMLILIMFMMVPYSCTKACMAYTLIGSATGLGLMYVLVLKFGWIGIPVSAMAGCGVILFLCLAKLSGNPGVEFARTMVMTLRIALSCMSMNGVYALIKLAGFDALGADRFMAAVQLVLMAVAGSAVDLFVTGIMNADSGLLKKRFNHDKT